MHVRRHAFSHAHKHANTRAGVGSRGESARVACRHGRSQTQSQRTWCLQRRISCSECWHSCVCAGLWTLVARPSLKDHFTHPFYIISALQVACPMLIESAPPVEAYQPCRSLPCYQARARQQRATSLPASSLQEAHERHLCPPLRPGGHVPTPMGQGGPSLGDVQLWASKGGGLAPGFGSSAASTAVRVPAPTHARTHARTHLRRTCLPLPERGPPHWKQCRLDRCLCARTHSRTHTRTHTLAHSLTHSRLSGAPACPCLSAPLPPRVAAASGCAARGVLCAHRGQARGVHRHGGGGQHEGGPFGGTLWGRGRSPWCGVGRPPASSTVGVR